MYGYHLHLETERKSGGKIITQKGSIHLVLYRLLDHGYISDRKVQVGKRMTRVYYHLELAGEQRLTELRRDYENATSGVFHILEESNTNAERTSYPAVSQ